MSSRGAELDEIMRDLDRTTAAWAAAGHGYDTPEAEAREAVFARLRVWNAAGEQPQPRRDPLEAAPCGRCGHEHDDVCEAGVPALNDGTPDEYRCACPSWQPEEDDGPLTYPRELTPTAPYEPAF